RSRRSCSRGVRSRTSRRSRSSSRSEGRAGSSGDPGSARDRTARSRAHLRRESPRPGEALLEIPDQIVRVLDPDRQPNRAGTHARGEKLGFLELPVRRARGMDDEALRVADVREMRPYRQAANELLSRLAAAADVEREDRARALGKILLD